MQRRQLWQGMILVVLVALMLAACIPLIQITPVSGLTQTPGSDQDAPTLEPTEPTRLPVLPTPFYTPKEIVAQATNTPELDLP